MHISLSLPPSKFCPAIHQTVLPPDYLNFHSFNPWLLRPTAHSPLSEDKSYYKEYSRGSRFLLADPGVGQLSFHRTFPSS